MRRRQTVPDQWLLVTTPDDWRMAKRLPRGSGVLLLGPLPALALRRLRQVALDRRLMLVRERPGSAVRVHNLRELRDAMLRNTPLIFLSPLYPTRSHPDWQPIPRMRAASLARLGRRRLLALGGMDARKFARVKDLGFRGWAGISAFRT